MDPVALHGLIVAERVDCAEFVPAVATLLFEHIESVGEMLDIRVLVVSSEGWRTDRHEFYRRLSSPRTRLINAYGLTEATIDSTYFEAEEQLLPDRFVPIGRPFANSEIYILDRNLEPVPPGIPGELCIGGAGVALGYLNRPELTAERFVKSPLERGGRLYRTGDLARWLPDGDVEFLGRADRQLKIRGFRIEPGEIEAVLEREPGVRTAVVVPWERRPGDVRLVAYCESGDPEGQLDAQKLRDALVAELPGFMIPSAFISVPAFALTPNGKVDRSALPEPEADDFAEQEAVPLSTETEYAIANLWREVLGLETVGASDNFFSLGGHSLLAAQVISRISAHLGVELTLRAVFEAPTIAELATLADRARTLIDADTAAPVLKRLDRAQHLVSLVPSDDPSVEQANLSRGR